MQLSLVTEANISSPCVEQVCELDRAFDQSVLRLGTRLAQTAFKAYPDLADRFSKFEFIIVEKVGPGSISSAAGKVVIFRGTQKLHIDEKALAFLIAREMGHVISRHHDEKSATNIMFSVVAAMAMPVTSLISGSTILAQTAATSTAATSAASFVGSQMTIESYRLDQLHEADAVAVNLLGKLGWSRSDIAYSLLNVTYAMGDDSWSNEFRASAEDVVRLNGSQNSITGLDIDSAGKGKIIIKIGLAQPLKKLPAGFVTDDPPRIVFDFLNTTNGMGKSVQTFTEKNLHSANIDQATGCTRLAINLNRMLSYNARIKGSNLFITLQGKAARTASAGDAPRIAKADPAMHQTADYR